MRGLSMALLVKSPAMLITALLLVSCSTGVRFEPDVFFNGDKPAYVCKDYERLEQDLAHAQMNLEIYELQQNVERSLVFREKMEAQLNRVVELSRQDKPLPPAFIDRFSLAVKQEVDLMRPVVATMARHGCWLEHQEFDVSNEIKLKGNMLVLATLVSLYDEYGAVFTVINENDRLRRFLNNEDKGYQRDAYQLESLTEMFVREELMAYTTELVRTYNSNRHSVEAMAQHDPNLGYLVQIVERSRSYPVLLEMDFFDAESHRRDVRHRVAADTLNNIGRSMVDSLSAGFSNAVGSYEERKGLLYGDSSLESRLASQLEMGDILLEKTPFRLTDSMIPGHWGHAAIWIGSKQELQAIGLWEHPLVIPYHKQIENSELVAESLRTGTQLSTLAHFMNVDDIAILRSRQPMTDEAMRETIILALRQIGKEYDFNFDVETTDKIVCSQLVYLAYDHISWPTESVVGRYTISPDNIAIKALDNGPLQLVTFYHNGDRVSDNAEAVMQQLMWQDR